MLEGVEMDQENVPAQGQPDTERLKSLHNYALAIYVLYLAGFVLGGISTLLGFILALIKAPEAKGTYLESHYRLLVHTFVWGLVAGVVGGVLLFIGVGIIILAVAGIWILYLWVRGLVRLLDGQPA
jgi:uncharacterized membrane protein